MTNDTDTVLRPYVGFGEKVEQVAKRCAAPLMLGVLALPITASTAPQKEKPRFDVSVIPPLDPSQKVWHLIRPLFVSP